ncbi:hypothetical protein Ancab_038385 [Ancistrocladus abbreviatus]
MATLFKGAALGGLLGDEAGRSAIEVPGPPAVGVEAAGVGADGVGGEEIGDEGDLAAVFGAEAGAETGVVFTEGDGVGEGVETAFGGDAAGALVGDTVGADFGD